MKAAFTAMTTEFLFLYVYVHMGMCVFTELAAQQVVTERP